MNIFTTEHPLNCEAEPKNSAWRRYSSRMLLGALILSPFVAVAVWILNQSEDADSTPDIPTLPFWMDYVVAMFFSLTIAFVVTALIALFAGAVKLLSKQRG